ncbi:MAG: T9SS type A sorting domain-containing protein [Ignavibacterium sp.]|nr:MAG: T9SS type A sorting domain-containing protein [Ignavibacterium sp.]
MKKYTHFILAVFCALIFSNNTVSQILLADNFEYPDGEVLSNHGWIVHVGAGSNAPKAVAPGLVFPSHPGTGVGNTAQLNNDGEQLHRLFNSVTTGPVYTSFMVAVNSAGGGGYFLHYAPNPHSSDYRGAVFANDDAQSQLAFGLGFGNGGGEVYAGGYNFGETYLLILKYENIAGADNDLVSLYIYDASTPPPNTEPAVATLGPFPAGGVSEINPGAINLSQYHSSMDVFVDGIIISPTWLLAVPVELTSFTESVNGNSTILNWATASELNNSGFDILRKAHNGKWEKIAFVEGYGTTTEVHNYSYIDDNLTVGKYSYRLKQIDLNGSFEYSDVVNAEITKPLNFKLFQNHPNPFNPSTSINFQIQETGLVSLIVYDILGNKITTLLSEKKEPGYYTVNYDASNLSSGTYIYQLRMGSLVETKKLILIK